jgi:hypothetical protein
MPNINSVGLKMREGTIYFEFQPPSWPPNSLRCIERVERDGSVMKVVCFPDGHFALSVAYLGEQKEYHFQRVNIPQGCFVKLAFSWCHTGVSAAAGGQMLAPYEESKEMVLDLNTKGNVTYKMGQLTISSVVLRRASRDERLFIESLGDITQKLTTGLRYDLVRLSAIIRQLLCDATPLVIAVNRELKQNLSFEIASNANEIIIEADALITNWRSLYPERQAEVISVNLKKFLKLEVITHNGVRCTVRHVILVVAHIFGGVHLGKSSEDNDRVLETLENEVLLYDESLVFHSLHDIGKVTLKALMPLAEAIIKRLDISFNAD